jgi:C-terminal processing protease CtpA/Prc
MLSEGRWTHDHPITFERAQQFGLPAAAYLTWQGKLIEGKGVTPSVPVELLPDDLLAGQDPQMQKAIEIVRGM